MNFEIDRAKQEQLMCKVHVHKLPNKKVKKKSRYAHSRVKHGFLRSAALSHDIINIIRNIHAVAP